MGSSFRLLSSLVLCPQGGNLWPDCPPRPSLAQAIPASSRHMYAPCPPPSPLPLLLFHPSLSQKMAASPLHSARITPLDSDACFLVPNSPDIAGGRAGGRSDSYQRDLSKTLQKSVLVKCSGGRRKSSINGKMIQ